MMSKLVLVSPQKLAAMSQINMAELAKQGRANLPKHVEEVLTTERELVQTKTTENWHGKRNKNSKHQNASKNITAIARRNNISTKAVSSSKIVRRKMKVTKATPSTSCTTGINESTFQPGEMYYSCQSCPKIFQKPIEVDQHFNDVHAPDRKFQCEICNKVYSVRHRLNTHLLTHKPDRPFKCESCGKAFKLGSQLKEHTKIHTGEMRHFCDKCDYATTNKTVLQYHIDRRHNRTLDYVCHLCGKRFPLPVDLRIHLETHGERNFKCDECDKAFHSQYKLSTHKKIHNPNRTIYQCEICGTNYVHRSGLTLHLQTHAGVTKFKCDICGKKVSSSGTLADHRRIHTGEKPFSCEVCGKAFNSKKYLFIHNRIHTGEKPFKCNQCGKAYSQRGTLTIHLKSHTGLKPFQCEICSKAFVTRSLLSAHLKTH